MRYTHNINASKCLEWGLNLNQGALVDIINQSASWATPCVVGNKTYYWVSRNKVIEEIPVAYSKADTVYRALRLLADKGIIEHIKDGKKDLVRLTEKGKSWNVVGTTHGDLKLGNKSESEINPHKIGNKSEKGSEKYPTDNNTSNSPNTNDNNTKKTKKKEIAPKDIFKPTKPNEVSDQTWSDLLRLRKTKRAVESKTAWTRINNAIERAQQSTGHSLEDIYSYWVMRAWSGFDDRWYVNAHPKQKAITSTRNNGYERQSDYSDFTQSVQQQLMQQFEREDAQETDHHFGCRDVYPMED